MVYKYLLNIVLGIMYVVKFLYIPLIIPFRKRANVVVKLYMEINGIKRPYVSKGELGSIPKGLEKELTSNKRKELSWLTKIRVMVYFYLVWVWFNNNLTFGLLDNRKLCYVISNKEKLKLNKSISEGSLNLLPTWVVYKALVLTFENNLYHYYAYSNYRTKNKYYLIKLDNTMYYTWK